MTPEGLTRRSSSFGHAETLARLRAAVTDLGMAMVAEIDRAAAARMAGLELRPTHVLVFGNPHAGTPLMQAEPTIAIDLPLRALVWTEPDDTTWLATYDLDWLVARHGAQAGSELLRAPMRQALAVVADRATRRAEGRS